MIKWKSKLLLAALAIGGTSYIGATLWAHSTGMNGLTNKNGGDGCTCHGGKSSAVTVSINGPETLAPGATGSYSVTIAGGPLAKAGTDIAASAGTLTPGSGMKTQSGDITHTSPKAVSGGVVTYDFMYTAPASEGDVTLFATGNSVNGNGNNTGDQWNHAPNKVIAVKQGTDVSEQGQPEGFSLKQNYPNPFNPSTTLSFEIPVAGKVQIYLRDIQGRTIRMLVDQVVAAGEFSRNFDFSDLPSGNYLYTLAYNGKTQSRMMSLVK